MRWFAKPSWHLDAAALAALAFALVLTRPRFLIVLTYPVAIALLARYGPRRVGLRAWSRYRPRNTGYRPRDTGAGRWLDAPVAELDKSTVGKLLASRASRDPGLHVVVRSTPPPACSDALYDAELDG